MMRAEGVDDWISHYDHELTTDEHSSTVLQTAIESGGGATFEREESVAEAAKKAEKHKGSMCKSAVEACEEGEDEACDALLEDCGYSADEIADLKAAFDSMGETFNAEGTIYDPTTDTDADDDGGLSFEEWAAANEPEASEPPAQELAQIAPTPTDDTEELKGMPGPALRALKKAWSGYKTARQEQREATERANHYAEVINGVRAVNGQDPLTFDELEGFAGGAVMPDDPTETYPSDDGQETIEEAAAKGKVSSAIQASLAGFTGEVYDPIGEFK
jgi:hypothetical protein